MPARHRPRARARPVPRASRRRSRPEPAVRRDWYSGSGRMRNGDRAPWPGLGVGMSPALRQMPANGCNRYRIAAPDRRYVMRSAVQPRRPVAVLAPQDRKEALVHRQVAVPLVAVVDVADVGRMELRLRIHAMRND